MLPDPSPANVHQAPPASRAKFYLSSDDSFQDGQDVLKEEARQLQQDAPMQQPVRPIRRLNGKQMIKMTDTPPEGTQPYSKPNKRKNPFPQRAVDKKKMVLFRICRDCKDSIIVDGNRQMTCQLCVDCKQRLFK